MQELEHLYTRAVDGTLDEAGTERLRELLASDDQAETDPGRMQRFLQVIAQSARRPALNNPDFFNQSLLERIRREDGSIEAQRPARQRVWSGLPVWARFAWGGAACLLAALSMTLALKPYAPAQQHARTTRVLSLHEFAKGTRATAIASPDNHYAVVWIDGIDHIPATTRIP